ncbi:signal transduction histidine kinase [Edaphobacter lichenicola]|uniref:Signal transduction histidine kinase n=1 Tax=Tunturiibacter lichenicola TaxID=2051959 RepID=A0A7W8JBL2_9BACT|nr:signal transduction histidine kinase [Edaphobacter lichenicola]
MPYDDRFRSGELSEWREYSGDWSTINSKVRNQSDERGAKLISGSPYWKDYEVEADVELLGRGNAGLIIRASDIEDGVDAYSGYYAGISTDDQALVIGRADHGWLEFPPKHMQGGVIPNHVYHLTLSAVGCVIQASATDVASAQRTSTDVFDPDCITEGMFGLRSVESGGLWSKVQVKAVDAKNSSIEQSLRPTETSLYPTSQGEYPHADGLVRNADPLKGPYIPEAEILPISSLRLLAVSQPTHVNLRGVVVLTTPHIYVQDATAGAQVVLRNDSYLKIGDEIEVSGQATVDDFSVRIADATISGLAGVLPAPALSITPLQASTGNYDSMFVEIEGRLDAMLPGKDLDMKIRLSGGQQEFYAIPSTTEIAGHLRNLKEGSVLRLRGICMLGSIYTQNRLPFALVLRSPDDVKVLSGPPWWTPQHLGSMGAIMLVLGFLAHVFYGRAEQWRHQAVLDERERLAHEMHDTLAQSFAGLDFQLRAIRNHFSQKSSDIDAPKMQQELNRACELVRHSHDEARRSLTSLRPEILEKAGLAEALSQVGRRMVAGSSLLVTTHVTGQARVLPLRVVDGFFRIGQEAIANAVMHSEAKHLTIALEYRRAILFMSIRDDGEGFEKTDDYEGFGLTGMRRRAERINARLDIISDGNGTTITVAAPCRPNRLWPFSLEYIKDRWRNTVRPHDEC